MRRWLVASRSARPARPARLLQLGADPGGRRRVRGRDDFRLGRGRLGQRSRGRLGATAREQLAGRKGATGDGDGQHRAFPYRAYRSGPHSGWRWPGKRERIRSEPWSTSIKDSRRAGSWRKPWFHGKCACATLRGSRWRRSCRPTAWGARSRPMIRAARSSRVGRRRTYGCGRPCGTGTCATFSCLPPAGISRSEQDGWWTTSKAARAAPAWEASSAGAGGMSHRSAPTARRFGTSP